MNDPKQKPGMFESWTEFAARMVVLIGVVAILFLATAVFLSTFGGF